MSMTSVVRRVRVLELILIYISVHSLMLCAQLHTAICCVLVLARFEPARDPGEGRRRVGLSRFILFHHHVHKFVFSSQIWCYNERWRPTHSRTVTTLARALEGRKSSPRSWFARTLQLDRAYGSMCTSVQYEETPRNLGICQNPT